MKKALLMLFSVALPVFAADHISTEDLQLDKRISEAEYALAPEPLYPFVLVPGMEELFEDAWGIYAEVEGYMYVKNLETKEIVQISDEPVYPVFEDTLEHLYFITEDNQLVQTDYTGELWQVLYEAEYGTLASVRYLSGNLFFLDGEYVYKFDLANKLAVPLRMVPDAVSVYPCADGSLLLRDQDNNYMVYNLQTKNFSTGLTEYEANALRSADSIPLTVAESENATLAVVNPVVINNITLPLSSYPHRSYFTKNKTACEHEKNGDSQCEDYRYNKQCWGFAQMVYETYSHISESTSYSVPSADKTSYKYYSNSLGNYYYVGLQSDTGMKVYMQQLTKGTHVRLSKVDYPQDEDDPGTHSLIFVSAGTSSVVTYDANRTANCKVAYETRTYSDMFDSYKFKVFHWSHSFTSNPVYYSTTHHKVQCANCIGYLLGAHNFVTSGGQTRCSGCGCLQPLVP